ncbi:MAG: ribonuclease Z [Clostridia bacterium]|nr:ribonuclease Z [Clostridia bacterium]
MKLIFIGTSHGVPEPDRRCSSCIVEAGGSYYLFDMGTQVVEDLRKRGIAVEDVRLAICTHPHGDHTDGLISFVDLANWYFKAADPLILLPDPRMIPPLRAWISATDEGKPLREDLRIASFREGVAYEDETLRVTAIRTKHCENSFAFLLEAEEKKVLLTGDLCRPGVDFPQIAFETALDLLVCEAAHFSPEDCIPFFDRTKAKRILHTHVNERRWADALTRQLAAAHPYAYGVAFDGMEVTV